MKKYESNVNIFSKIEQLQERSSDRTVTQQPQSTRAKDRAVIFVESFVWHKRTHRTLSEGP
jgi:hypothetical protein